MTANELREFINNSLHNRNHPDWILDDRGNPIALDVDKETYLNAFREIINSKIDRTGEFCNIGRFIVLPISVGPNRGLYFKSIELICKD